MGIGDENNIRSTAHWILRRANHEHAHPSPDDVGPRRLALTSFGACLLVVPSYFESIAAVGTLALVPWLLAPWIPDALQSLGSSPMTSLVGLVTVCAVVGAPRFVGLALLAHVTANVPTLTRIFLFGYGVFAIEWLLSYARWGVPFGLLGDSQLGLIGIAQLAVVGGVPLISAWLAGDPGCAR